jgi:hypothetical protein
LISLFPALKNNRRRILSGFDRLFQRKKSAFFLIAILSSFFYRQAGAQTLASTQDGEIVILFDDGSWKFAPTYEIVNSRSFGCSFEDFDTAGRLHILKKASFVNHGYGVLKTDYRLNNYIQADLAIGETEGKAKVVYFNYTLRSIYGPFDHGIIQEGRKMLVKLKNNTTVELVLDQSDKGIVDRIHNETRYRTFAMISPANETALKNNEVEMILMPWSRGNEIYKVIYPRVFIDQLTCFD